VKEEDRKRQGHEQVHDVRLAPSAAHAAAAAIKEGLHLTTEGARFEVSAKCSTALPGGVLQAPPFGTKHVFEGPVEMWGGCMGGWMKTRGIGWWDTLL